MNTVHPCRYALKRDSYSEENPLKRVEIECVAGWTIINNQQVSNQWSMGVPQPVLTGFECSGVGFTPFRQARTALGIGMLGRLFEWGVRGH